MSTKMTLMLIIIIIIIHFIMIIYTRIIVIIVIVDIPRLQHLTDEQMSFMYIILYTLSTSLYFIASWPDVEWLYFFLHFCLVFVLIFIYFLKFDCFNVNRWRKSIQFCLDNWWRSNKINRQFFTLHEYIDSCSKMGQ